MPTAHCARLIAEYGRPPRSLRRVQLQDVLDICRRSASLSAAGRVLFDHSRERKKIANNADRLRKYLARFDLEWDELTEQLRGTPS